MKRVTINTYVDMALGLFMLGLILTGLLMAFVVPPGTGHSLQVWTLGRHQWGTVHLWLAGGLIAAVVLHLVLHWGWVVAATLRALRRSARITPPRRRRIIGAVTSAALVLLVAGFLGLSTASVTAREDRARRGHGAHRAVDVDPGASHLDPARSSLGAPGRPQDR